MTSQPLFQDTLILRRFRGGNLADIIKSLTMFTKATFENSKKWKRSIINALKCNLYLHFLIYQKLLIFDEKNADLLFGSFLGKV